MTASVEIKIETVGPDPETGQVTNSYKGRVVVIEMTIPEAASLGYNNTDEKVSEMKELILQALRDMDAKDGDFDPTHSEDTDGHFAKLKNSQCGDADGDFDIAGVRDNPRNVQPMAYNLSI